MPCFGPPIDSMGSEPHPLSNSCLPTRMNFLHLSASFLYSKPFSVCLSKSLLRLQILCKL